MSAQDLLTAALAVILSAKIDKDEAALQVRDARSPSDSQA